VAFDMVWLVAEFITYWRSRAKAMTAPPIAAWLSTAGSMKGGSPG